MTALERFTALGLEVAYTELDIRHASVPASASELATQGDDYANVVGSCLDVEGCVGVTVWVFTDKYSWVPDTFSGAGEACLYDEDYNKKAAWTSVSSVLAAVATSASSTSATTVSASAAETTAETTVAAEGTEAAKTTPASTPSSEPVVSSVQQASTPVYTPILSTPTTFLTRVNTGSFNQSTPQTTFAATTTPAAISVPDSSIQYPSLSIPSNKTETAAGSAVFVTTTLAAVASSTSRVPVIRHSSSAAVVVPWTNGTVTTVVSNLPAGTGVVASAMPTETETDDYDDDDCEDEDEDEEEELVKHYYQCGGRNWTGATKCEDPYVCVEMNEWYYQCVEES